MRDNVIETARGGLVTQTNGEVEAIAVTDDFDADFRIPSESGGLTPETREAVLRG